MIDGINTQIHQKILLKVKAAAKNNKIEGFIEIDGKKYLKISIKAPPSKGKANQMIIKFLSKELGIEQSKLAISVGKTSKYKVLEIN